MKGDILGMFKEFYEKGRFVRNLNSTYRRKGGRGARAVDDPKDFRPISLVGSLYKMFAKVLANRLRRVLGKVVSVEA